MQLLYWHVCSIEGELFCKYLTTDSSDPSAWIGRSIARAHTHTDAHRHMHTHTYSHSAVIDFSQLNTAQHQPVLLTAQAGQREERRGRRRRWWWWLWRRRGRGRSLILMLLWLCYSTHSLLEGKWWRRHGWGMRRSWGMVGRLSLSLEGL